MGDVAFELSGGVCCAIASGMAPAIASARVVARIVVFMLLSFHGKYFTAPVS